MLCVSSCGKSDRNMDVEPRLGSLFSAMCFPSFRTSEVHRGLFEARPLRLPCWAFAEMRLWVRLGLHQISMTTWVAIARPCTSLELPLGCCWPHYWIFCCRRLGGSLLIGLFLYVVLCLPKVEGLYGVIWGHMGSYDVIWYRSKTDQKKQKQPGFPVATSRGEVPGGCRQVVDVSIHFGGLITNWN